MKRIRIERPKRARERPWFDILPLDPRDPDVVRAKELLDRCDGRGRDPIPSAEETGS